MIKLIRSLKNFVIADPGSVVTIGSFDGFHLGHQQLLAEVNNQSKQLGLIKVVMTFEPQPYEYFHKKSRPRLMRLREKCQALIAERIDYLLCLRFNKALANLSAEDFVQKILVDALNVKVMVIGDDFHFGAKRMGDGNMLRQLGEQLGFAVIQLPTFLLEGERVSSTRVRKALENGDIPLVNELLGRHFSVTGKVIHGDKRGRELGFPTANINLHRSNIPLSGIYVVQVLGLEEGVLQGVANVGTRPTFDGVRILLEVYIFNFNRKIYNENIQVEFLHKIRDEERYETLEALVDKIKEDVEAATSYFSKLHS